MLTPTEFSDRIERYLTDAKMPATRFGIEAVRDPNFVHDVRKGRVPSLTLAGQVLAFIESNPPAPEASDLREAV